MNWSGLADLVTSVFYFGFLSLILVRGAMSWHARSYRQGYRQGRSDERHQPQEPGKE